MSIRDAIRGELRKIENSHHVRILHAVESGSRAWGFSSPDSDYDVRFVYIRPAIDYLRLNEPRDVIEWVNDGVLDINGWDLKKALRQFACGNATLFEWSLSPAVYETTSDWSVIQAASEAYFSEKTAAHHYYGTAMSTWLKHLKGDTVRFKKYFYALRPLLAARYIERYHKAPPVPFSELMKMDMAPELRAAINTLLEQKKKTTEGERHPHMPLILDFIRDELARQNEICRAMPDDRPRNIMPLETCFIRLLGLNPAPPAK